jgi:hypothetical protein
MQEMCTQLGCKCNCQGQSPSFFFAGKQSPSLTSLDKRDYYTCCTQYSNPGSHASQNTTSGVVPKGRVLDLGNLALCAHWQAPFFWMCETTTAFQSFQLLKVGSGVSCTDGDRRRRRRSGSAGAVGVHVPGSHFGKPYPCADTPPWCTVHWTLDTGQWRCIRSSTHPHSSPILISKSGY